MIAEAKRILSCLLVFSLSGTAQAVPKSAAPSAAPKIITELPGLVLTAGGDDKVSWAVDRLRAGLMTSVPAPDGAAALAAPDLQPGDDALISAFINGAQREFLAIRSGGPGLVAVNGEPLSSWKNALAAPALTVLQVPADTLVSEDKASLPESARQLETFLGILRKHKGAGFNAETLRRVADEMWVGAGNAPEDVPVPSAPVDGEPSAKAAVIVTENALPKSVMRSHRGAALAGPKADDILEAVVLDAFRRTFSEDAAKLADTSGAEWNKVRLADRTLLTALTVQGLWRRPLTEWLSEQDRKPTHVLGVDRESLSVYAQKLNLALAAFPSADGVLMPQGGSRGIDVLFDDEASQAASLGLPDLREAGAFHWEGHLYFYQGFIDAAPPQTIAAAMLAVILAQRGMERDEIRELVLKTTAKAFGEENAVDTRNFEFRVATTGGLNAWLKTLPKRRESARWNSIRVEPLRKPAYKPRWRARLRAAAARWAEAIAPALKMAPYFIPAMLAALLSLATLRFPNFTRQAWQAVAVLALAIAGELLYMLKTGQLKQEPPPVDPVLERTRRGLLPLETDSAVVQDIKDFSKMPVATPRRELLFTLQTGGVSLAIDKERKKPALAEVIYFERNSEWAFTIVSDKRFDSDDSLVDAIPVSKFFNEAWPGLERAMVTFLSRTDPSEREQRLQVAAFYKDLRKILEKLGGDGESVSN